MKAAIFERYGPPEVLKIVEVPKPSIKKDEVLIKVKAVAVTAGDSRIRGARFPKGFGPFARLAFGVIRPRNKILGNTYSGIVEKTGNNVSGLKPGDEVCGMTGIAMGAFAEYLKTSKLKSIAKKPKKISHVQAAGLIFGGTTALYFIRDKAKLRAGEQVAVNGASGAVGTNAVQLASYFGAEVTGVTSAKNSSLVKNLGAKHIIDYQKQSLISSGQKFDVVIDTVGNITPKVGKTLLNKNGRLVLVVASLWDTIRSRGPVKSGTAKEDKNDIEFLLKLVEQGALTVVIDKEYNFQDIVAAHKRVDSGQKVGNVVLKL